MSSSSFSSSPPLASTSTIAAAMASTISSAHSRSRSSSDPFSDPIYPTSTSLASTNLRRERTPLPAPPPKDHPNVKSVEIASRHKTTRSNTSVLPLNPVGLQPPKNTRSLSQDSVTTTNNDKRRPRAKKGSMHADIIDRLDFSAVGSAMFHHDGPFDACAPSRNRNRTKAPMLAWSSSLGNDNAPPLSSPDYDNDSALTYSSLVESSYPSPPLPVIPPTQPIRSYSDIAGKGRLSETLPKKRTDALAEAWGVAEPEPFEEFLAGGGSGKGSAASSMFRDKEGHNPSGQGGNHTSPRRGRDARDLREIYREYLDDGRLTAGTRRNAIRNPVPPPQPIVLPGEVQKSSDEQDRSPTGAGAATKRSRSLMQRLRKMRETPNVPISPHDEKEPSPSSSVDSQYATTPLPSRPGYRSNTSFLGRLGRSDSAASGSMSPISDKLANDPLTEKSLPTLPPDSPDSVGGTSGGEQYFETSLNGAPGSSGGMTRKASLMRKVVRGVKRAGK